MSFNNLEIGGKENFPSPPPPIVCSRCEELEQELAIMYVKSISGYHRTDPIQYLLEEIDVTMPIKIYKERTDCLEENWKFFIDRLSLNMGYHAIIRARDMIGDLDINVILPAFIATLKANKFGLTNENTWSTILSQLIVSSMPALEFLGLILPNEKFETKDIDSLFLKLPKPKELFINFIKDIRIQWPGLPTETAIRMVSLLKPATIEATIAHPSDRNTIITRARESR